MRSWSSRVWVPVKCVTFSYAQIHLRKARIHHFYFHLWVEYLDRFYSTALVGHQSNAEVNGNLLLENILLSQSWIERDIITKACITYGT